MVCPRLFCSDVAVADCCGTRVDTDCISSCANAVGFAVCHRFVFLDYLLPHSGLKNTIKMKLTPGQISRRLFFASYGFLAGCLLIMLYAYWAKNFHPSLAIAGIILCLLSVFFRYLAGEQLKGPDYYNDDY